jgi:hypothetical protein
MRNFEEYLKNGLIKKKKMDVARSRNLIEGAKKRKNLLEKYLPVNEETSFRVIEECYDIIKELLESCLSKDGYKSYNHESVVSYMGVLGFSEGDVKFVDKLREVRNGTKYYGKNVSLEYCHNVKRFLDQVYDKLIKLAFE